MADQLVSMLDWRSIIYSSTQTTEVNDIWTDNWYMITSRKFWVPMWYHVMEFDVVKEGIWPELQQVIDRFHVELKHFC